MRLCFVSFENYGQGSSVSSIEHQLNLFAEKENMSAFPQYGHHYNEKSVEFTHSRRCVHKLHCRRL